jgi:hypothetical protein
MLQRLFGRLADASASTVGLVSHDAAQTTGRPLHQLSAEHFDAATATGDSLCSWHADGDGFHYAVGADDWVPLAVAGFCLTTSWQYAAWLDQTLCHRAWMKDDVLESWHTANRSVLLGFGARLDQQGRSSARTWPSPDTEQDLAPLLKVGEMAELFAITWQRFHVVSPFRVLGNTEPYERLGAHHALRHAHQANEHALERVLAWLSLWLEARGMTVDRNGQRVHLPGYRALYYRSSAEMWT